MSDETNVSKPNPSPKLSPLTASEVVQIATDLQTLVGAQLQDCLQTQSELGLAFYHRGETLWLWIDLNPQCPLIVRVHGKAPPRKKITRPLSLFLKSRLTGRRLSFVRAVLDRGRVLLFGFHRSKEEETDEPCEIEILLFPHGQNIIARDGQKSVAESKPKEIPLTSNFTVDTSTARPWNEIENLWRSRQEKRGVAAAPRDAAQLERDWKRSIEKKEKALEKMKEDLEKKSTSVYRNAGEWLKAHGTLEFPPEMPVEFREVIDPSRTFSENVETLFTRAKDNVRKLEGTRGRIETMEHEIAALRARGPGGFAKSREKSEKSAKENLLSRADAKGRRHALREDLEVYVGKSAGDNLALLRRAQPFDYWLHLRDQPGSHAIMRRTRGRTVTDSEFFEAGKWVIEQSLGKRLHELSGERFDLLIVECRFVRPIKGDKLGRVHYTNDRVLSIRL